MKAALPAAPKVKDLSRIELIEILRLVRDRKYPFQLYYRELFDRNVVMPVASSLLDCLENWKP